MLALDEQFMLAHVGADSVHSHASQRGNADERAHVIGGALDSESGERSEVLIERTVVPESCLAATDASVARLNGIAGRPIPLGHRAGVVGNRAAASHFVQAVSFACFLIVEGFDK